VKPVTPASAFTVRFSKAVVAVPGVYAPVFTHTVWPAPAALTARWTSAVVVVVGDQKLDGVT
jgi:hypothetical protein